MLPLRSRDERVPPEEHGQQSPKAQTLCFPPFPSPPPQNPAPSQEGRRSRAPRDAAPPEPGCGRRCEPVTPPWALCPCGSARGQRWTRSINPAVNFRSGPGPPARSGAVCGVRPWRGAGCPEPGAAPGKGRAEPRLLLRPGTPRAPSACPAPRRGPACTAVPEDRRKASAGAVGAGPGCSSGGFGCRGRCWDGVGMLGVWMKGAAAASWEGIGFVHGARWWEQGKEQALELWDQQNHRELGV